MGLSRDGQPMTLKAQLADRKGLCILRPKDFNFVMPAMPAHARISRCPVSIVVVHSSARSGLMVENLTPQLGDFFGTKDGQGCWCVGGKGELRRKSRFPRRRCDCADRRRSDQRQRRFQSCSCQAQGQHRQRRRDSRQERTDLTLALPERKQSGVMEESLRAGDRCRNPRRNGPASIGTGPDQAGNGTGCAANGAGEAGVAEGGARGNQTAESRSWSGSSRSSASNCRNADHAMRVSLRRFKASSTQIPDPCSHRISSSGSVSSAGILAVSGRQQNPVASRLFCGVEAGVGRFHQFIPRRAMIRVVRRCRR